MNEGAGILLLTLPLKDPVLIIALILIILLVAPLISERIRIPYIIGLLISGAVIGPHGLNLVSPDLEFSLFGTMGLLYLMFLAGLEIDLVDFMENKLKSTVIGLASYFIPFIIGLAVCRYLLDYEFTASWLIAAMFSSHTLISYPLLGRLGIINRSIVTIAIGATIIADVLALFSMQMITTAGAEGFEFQGLLSLMLRFSVLLVTVLFGLSRLARFFFLRYEGYLGVQYTFVLAMLFLSAAAAHLLKIEPILGAFLCGLVLNRLIINSSPLYVRIEFIGNNLFIPFFLISIGILANFRIYVDEPLQIGLLLVLILAAVTGKYLASQLSRLILRLSRVETNLLFGLSVSRAASAIAIILIGFNLGVIDESILNNTVILILITCIVSGYITQKSARKIHLQESETPTEETSPRQKLLIPISNPSTMTNLLAFSILIKMEENRQPIHPLTVYTDRKLAEEQIDESRKRINSSIRSLHTEIQYEPIFRIDINVTNGIIRAAEEVAATAIIMGWANPSTTWGILFGSILKSLHKRTEIMVMVLKVPVTFRKIRRIHLFCPPNAHFERGFQAWLETLILLARKLKTKIWISCESSDTLEAIRSWNARKKTGRLFDYRTYGREYDSGDLLVFVTARTKSLSYNRQYEHFVDKKIEVASNCDILVIYPQQ
jgi:Kef-type K+ transport system membrane component KefB